MKRSQYSPQALKPFLVGVFNMQYTLYNAEQNLDEAALRENTNFMIQKGILAGRGVQIIGAQAGEGACLSDTEYRQLMDIIVKETAGRVPIGVGCIRPTTHAVIELAQYAEGAGADFVLVMPPYYHPNLPCPVDLVYEHYQALARAVKIGIMVHNAPSATGQNLSIAMLNRLAEIEQIIAYKEDRQDFGGLREVVYRFKDRFMINANSYKALIPLDYQFGLTGYNSFLGNVDPAYALRQHDLALSGDFQQCHEFWAKGLDLFTYLQGGSKYNMLELGKEMARIAGRSMGSCERFPLRRPGNAERMKLRRLMEQAGMAVNSELLNNSL